MKKLLPLKKSASIKIAAAAGTAVLIAAVCAAIWTGTHYVAAGGKLYPKNEQVLDLRGRNLSEKNYIVLEEKLLGCEILWDVPFQDTFCSSDTREITVSALTDEDVARLDYLTQLETVHGEQCRDYAQLMALQQRHPDCAVLYEITLEGRTYAQDALEVTVPNLTAEEAGLLDYLPRLTVVDASGCRDYDLLIALQQAHPKWKVVYTVSIAGEEFPADAKELTVSGAAYEELSRELAGMPRLESLNLVNPAADGESLLLLREEYPDVSIHWQVDVFGQTVADDAVELDISGVELDSVAQAEEIAARFPELETLIMSDCGIDNETMAEFRERKREDYKVVWTVYMSDKCKARTDDTYFMPIKQGEYYFQEQHVYNLRYCEDMICIDLGHSTIKTIDFVSYMPHLKYLILAHTQVSDITPISSCKELVFLELDWTPVKDYEPLLDCTALEDLNLGKTYGDPEPITKMTWLKNLWWLDRSAPIRAQVQEALPDTNMMFTGNATVANGWRNLPNYYAMRDALGMYYMTW